MAQYRPQIMGAFCRLLLCGLAVAIAGCGNKGPGTGPATAARAPLSELGTGTYKGFVGGLYPAGGNVEPTAHAAAGQSRAQAVTSLDTSGTPNAGGKVVLLSLGMSNTTQEFCSGSSTTTNCSSWSFMGQAAADPTVNHTTLAIVNGARGGQDAQAWDAATDANYDTVRLNRLGPLGLNERQVQIVWVKQADAGPRDSLASAQSDAYQLESRLGNIARALRTHYPNLKMIFLSSRIYAGYATTTDARAGDLNYNSGAAWLAWGPYLWADGLTPRQADGLVWQSTDFVQDGTHPSQSGQQKVATMLLAFFKTSPFTKCWFVTGGTCP